MDYISGIYLDLHDMNTKKLTFNSDNTITVTAFSPYQTIPPLHHPWMVVSS